MSLLAVLALQAFNAFVGYHMSTRAFIVSTAMFVGPALLVAALALSTRNPLRAVGACVLFAPWLVYAYVVDHVMPYAGGGASMVYVSVLFFGTPCALLGALMAGPLLRRAGVHVT